MKLALWGLLSFVVLVPAWLLVWPTPLTPTAWTPTPVMSEKPTIVSDVLKNAQRLALDLGHGPEGITVAPPGSPDSGTVYAGYADGRIIRLSPDGSHYQLLANTGGRPFGLAVTSDDRVLVADGVKGLLQVDRQGHITVLSRGAAGQEFGFTDDVDLQRPNGAVYFSDASSKFFFPDYLDDILEHGANGRLLRFDPVDGHTDVLLNHLHFANGVAMGPNGDYVLVDETSSYRIARYWLKGPKAGTHDVFVDGLPGFPDNLSFNGHDRFWVAIYAPRNPQLDALASHPFLRKIVSRLPAWMQPKPKRVARVLAFDLQGHEIVDLRDASVTAYAPITSVEEYGPWLWLGSKDENSIARIPLHSIFPNALEPPAGWHTAPEHPQAVPPLGE